MARANLKRLFLASATAAVLATSQAPAQSVVEPDGMPVYRAQKSSFFKNPFSTAYQRLWNKTKPQPETPTYDETIPSHTTNADYATVEAVEGEAPKVTRRKHTVKKPMSKMAGNLRRKPAATQKPQAPQPRVIHVDDVNEGTPPVGVTRDANADPEILKSLAPGEQVLKVTERVIGVYRDGKLVVVNPEEQHRYQPVGKAPAREIDPWFGDEVGVPTNEIPSEAIEGEALPPQSYDEYQDELYVPDLPPTPEVVEVERTSYIHVEPEMVMETETHPALEEMAPRTMPRRSMPIPREVQMRYQTAYPGR